MRGIVRAYNLSSPPTRGCLAFPNPARYRDPLPRSRARVHVVPCCPLWVLRPLRRCRGAGTAPSTTQTHRKGGQKTAVLIVSLR